MVQFYYCEAVVVGLVWGPQTYTANLHITNHTCVACASNPWRVSQGGSPFSSCWDPSEPGFNHL